VEADGLHNVYRITDKLLSGSGPEGEKSFGSLRKLGIKTIISVDGAKPDVELAKKYGLRYVHIPIGYDGVARSQAVQLAKAVRELPGPIYIHCHHGKHRGPTAAALAQLCADEKCQAETALEILKRAGTDPMYRGLFESVQKFQRPSGQELAAVRELPEVVKVAGLTQAMVSIDNAWSHLKLVRAVGWKPPKDQPDLDPQHEAKQLAEHFLEVTQLPETKDRPADFLHWLADGQVATKELENTLRSPKPDADAAEKAFKKSSTACSQCHAKYRDVPQK
jgi:protein tyrosine phosphatase (PTP) superfamily phosphohydrolase (DUF442 family)